MDDVILEEEPIGEIEISPYERDNLDKLADALCEPGAVLLIGSGISLWSGLPDWKTLLKRLTEYCAANEYDVKETNAAIDAGQYEDAAGDYATLCLEIRF